MTTCKGTLPSPCPHPAPALTLPHCPAAWVQAFVELPGYRKQGLIHFSQVSEEVQVCVMGLQACMGWGWVGGAERGRCCTLRAGVCEEVISAVMTPAGLMSPVGSVGFKWINESRMWGLQGRMVWVWGC